MMKQTARRSRKAAAEEKIQIGVYITRDKWDRLDAERTKERRSSLSEMCNVLLDEALELRAAK